jgi:mRNA interferase HigB
MRVIAIRTLREFWERHADAEQPLRSWYHEACSSGWPSPADIKKQYPSADILPGNRMVFNIKGNTYRLIVHIHYDRQIAYVRFVGTHSEYDKVDATTI